MQSSKTELTPVALGASPSATGKRCKTGKKFLKQRGKKYVFETNGNCRG